MKILTYEEIEKELYKIELNFELSLRCNQFTIFTADELIDRCFGLVKHFEQQSKFKRVFKRLSTRKKLDNLAIKIYDTPTQQE